jgi:hypothetical protein
MNFAPLWGFLLKSMMLKKELGITKPSFAKATTGDVKLPPGS